MKYPSFKILSLTRDYIKGTVDGGQFKWGAFLNTSCKNNFGDPEEFDVIKLYRGKTRLYAGTSRVSSTTEFPISDVGNR